MPLPDRWSLWAGRGCPRRCGKPSRELVADRSGATGFSTPPARSTDLFTLRGRNPLPTLGPGNPPSRLSGHAAARTGQSGHRPPRPGSGPPAPGPPQSPPGDWSRLQPFGNAGHGPVPRRRRDESEQETGSPNDRGMVDDFRLWGSSRCRRIGVTHFQEGGGDIEG